MTRATSWPRLGIALLVLSLGLLACNLFGSPDATTEPGNGPTETPVGGIPAIVINNPADGNEVVLGEEVLIQSTGRDVVGVTRVELRANGFIVNTVSSPSPTGETEFAVLQTWTPGASGAVVLDVVAYRGTIASDLASITVNVRETAAQVTATAPIPLGVTPEQFQDNVCRARVDVNGLNFRTGPTTDYDVLAVFTLGQAIPITGRLGDNSWWQVRSGANTGWISAQYTTTTGDCSLVSIAVPPPSPTPRPPTVTPSETPTNTPVPDQPTETPIPTTTFTPIPAIPDLVISAISGPAILELNESGTVGAQYVVTIRNQGTASTGQFSTSFRQPDGAVIQLPQLVVDLAPGQTVDLPVDVTFTESNTYRLEATADSGSSVAESDEGNNVRILDVVVTTPPS